MDLRRFNLRRNNPLLGIILSLGAGALISGAALGAKVGFSAGFSLWVLFSPIILLAGALGVGGFLLMQLAFRAWHLSAVMPLITGVVVLISNFLGSLLLVESISFLQWIAVGLLLGGILLMVFSAKP